MTTPLRNRVDLHCHTARSDGVLEPLELYAQLRAVGTTLVAITDHDTVAGVREIHAAGLGHAGTLDGPRILPGVEINTTAPPDLPGADDLAHADRELHIVGLGIAVDDDGLEAALVTQREGRRLRRDRILERLDALDLGVRDHLYLDESDDSEGRPHIAQALVAAGHAQSVDDAFARYLGVDGPAYVRRMGMGPHEAIAVISAAGGVAVLAHRPDAPDHPRLMASLIGAGLAGIEVYYHAFTDEQVESVRALADELGLLYSGGSDYHGFNDMSYASRQAQTHVPDSVGKAILERLSA